MGPFCRSACLLHHRGFGGDLSLRQSDAQRGPHAHHSQSGFLPVGGDAATTLPAVLFNLLGVLIAHLFRIYLFATINLVLASRYTGLRFSDVAREFIPPVVVSCVTAGTVALAGLALDAANLHFFVVFALKVLVAAITFAVTVLVGEKLGLWRPYTTTLMEAVRSKLKRRRPASGNAGKVPATAKNVSADVTGRRFVAWPISGWFKAGFRLPKRAAVDIDTTAHTSRMSLAPKKDFAAVRCRRCPRHAWIPSHPGRRRARLSRCCR